jgi:hypothetical protein
MTDEYAFWRAALANPVAIGETLPVHDGDPQPGFYRKRNGNKEPWQAVAIWRHEGRLVAFVNGRDADAATIWTFVCRNPISEAAYHDAMSGKPWADQDAVVAEQIAPGAGHNSAGIDEAALLAEQIEAAKKGCAAYAKIADDETLTKAQSLRSRLLELKGQAEKAHKKEKEPHLEAGRAVDKKWLPLAKDAEAAAKSVRDAMDAWETEKLRARREAERQAQIAAEVARIEALRAAEAGKPAPAPSPPPAAPVETMPTPIKGAYGRAASVGVVNVVTGIADQDALYAFLKNHPDLIACMLDLAKRAVAKGLDVPGVEVQERARVA